MWITFWPGIERLSPSNRRAVVPGAWRMEVSPADPAKEDVFLHVLEIGDRDGKPARRVAAIEGHVLQGAAVEGESTVLFADGEVSSAEATLPDLDTRGLLLAGVAPGAVYDLQVTSGFAPGAPVWHAIAAAGDEGTLSVEWKDVRGGRLRLRRLP